MPVRENFDAVIVGAGIIGAACAYYASRAGLKVAVVEREVPCAGSSGACEGNILSWDKEPGPEFDLFRLTFAQWEELARALSYDFEYHPRKGGIMVAERPDQLPAAEERAKWLAGEGIEVELLGPEGLRRHEPALASDLAGGLFLPADAQVEPRRATIAFLRAAGDLGATLVPHTPVVGLLRDGDAVRGVVTAGGEMTAPRVVLATGAWTGELGEQLGLQLPIRPRKGHLLVLERTRAPVQHKLMEAGYLDTLQSGSSDLQVAMVIETTRSGTIVIGSSRAIVGFDRATQPEVIGRVAARAVRFVPSLAGLRVIRTYAGLRPFSPDHLPAIGPVPGRDGLFVASGHEGAGICNAPATGLLMSRWLTDRPRDLPDEPYSPARFLVAA